MKSRHLLFSMFLLSLVSVLIALYLQLFDAALPCSLCVLQRYAFILIACCCLFGLFAGRIKWVSCFGFAVALLGVYFAAYQLWVIAHPVVQCGRDALEAVINSLWTAKLIPVLFRAESLCSDVPESFMVLTPPQWALLWFSLFAVAFVWIFIKEKKR